MNYSSLSVSLGKVATLLCSYACYEIPVEMEWNKKKKQRNFEFISSWSLLYLYNVYLGLIKNLHPNTCNKVEVNRTSIYSPEINFKALFGDISSSFFKKKNPTDLNYLLAWVRGAKNGSINSLSFFNIKYPWGYSAFP